MKYIVIDQTKTDWFTEEFDNKEDAIKAAENHFYYLTREEKRKCEGFYVLESANPDEDAEDHYDGDVVRDLLDEWEKAGKP